MAGEYAGGFSLWCESAVAHVREVLGCEALDDSAYVFRNRRATNIKVLVVDAQGVWLSVRRLHQRRFVWPAAGEPLWPLSRTQCRWLCARRTDSG